MTPASRPVRRASCSARQADPRIVSAPVTRMPEVTTNDPLFRLIVKGIVDVPGCSAVNISPLTRDLDSAHGPSLNLPRECSS